MLNSANSGPQLATIDSGEFVTENNSGESRDSVLSGAFAISLVFALQNKWLI